MLRIRIRRIHKFLGLLDPDPDPLVRGTDPDRAPDHSIIFFNFLSLKNDVNVPSKVGVLKVKDENGRIRIQIQIH